MTKVPGSRVLGSWRISRKERRCQSERSTFGPQHCLGRIRSGDRYCRSALPPGTDLGNTGWWRANLCQPCAEFYGHEAAPAVAA